MKKANVKEISTAAVKKVLASEESKSAKIKQLFDGGLEVKQIAELMQIRYNFAYNVISNYINMNGFEVERNQKASKKDAIIELHQAGKSNKEISIELKTNYNYVFNTLKDYKAQQKAE